MMEIDFITTEEKVGRICPDCGGPMTEVDRIAEGGFAYIWYECSAADCDGQWLERKSIDPI